VLIVEIPGEKDRKLRRILNTHAVICRWMPFEGHDEIILPICGGFGRCQRFNENTTVDVSCSSQLPATHIAN